MTELTPAYYAAGDVKLQFSVKGEGIAQHVGEIIGVSSDDNDDPLKYRYSQNAWYILGVTRISDNEIFVEGGAYHPYAADQYLGAIMTSDRKHVLFENTSRPLPNP